MLPAGQVRPVPNSRLRRGVFTGVVDRRHIDEPSAAQLFRDQRLVVQEFVAQGHREAADDAGIFGRNPRWRRLGLFGHFILRFGVNRKSIDTLSRWTAK